MSRKLEARTISVEEIVAAVKNNPKELIAAEEARYHKEIATVADTVHNSRGNRHIVLLSGPSSSGKTTTAGLLKHALKERGTVSHVVSLDDFYLGLGKAPLLPDGKPDYETLDALDVQRLLCCLEELVRDGKTDLPQFDFSTGQPKAETVPLVLEPDAAVIFEGIHAFNPRLQTYLPQEMTTRLFINSLSRFEWAGKRWLQRRDIRLMRRILRDDQFRASPFANTMEMWPQVVRGEKLYLFPYAETADCVVDTTFSYEPCVFRALLTPRLEAVDADIPDYDTARRLMDRLAVFPPLSADYLPAGAMLREFTG